MKVSHNHKNLFLIFEKTYNSLYPKRSYSSVEVLIMWRWTHTPRTLIEKMIEYICFCCQYFRGETLLSFISCNWCWALRPNCTYRFYTFSCLLKSYLNFFKFPISFQVSPRKLKDFQIKLWRCSVCRLPQKKSLMMTWGLEMPTYHQTCTVHLLSISIKLMQIDRRNTWLQLDHRNYVLTEFVFSV